MTLTITQYRPLIYGEMQARAAQRAALREARRRCRAELAESLRGFADYVFDWLLVVSAIAAAFWALRVVCLLFFPQ